METSNSKPQSQSQSQSQPQEPASASAPPTSASSHTSVFPVINQPPNRNWYPASAFPPNAIPPNLESPHSHPSQSQPSSQPPSQGQGQTRVFAAHPGFTHGVYQVAPAIPTGAVAAAESSASGSASRSQNQAYLNPQRGQYPIIQHHLSPPHPQPHPHTQSQAQGQQQQPQVQPKAPRLSKNKVAIDRQPGQSLLPLSWYAKSWTRTVN